MGTKKKKTANKHDAEWCKEPGCRNHIVHPKSKPEEIISRLLKERDIEKRRYLESVGWEASYKRLESKYEQVKEELRVLRARIAEAAWVFLDATLTQSERLSQSAKMLGFISEGEGRRGRVSTFPNKMAKQLYDKFVTPGKGESSIISLGIECCKDELLPFKKNKNTIAFKLSEGVYSKAYRIKSGQIDFTSPIEPKIAVLILKEYFGCHTLRSCEEALKKAGCEGVPSFRESHNKEQAGQHPPLRF